MYKKWHKKKSNYKSQERYKLKSSFEETVAAQLEQLGFSVLYETKYIRYTQPAKQRKYLIDFDLGAFYVEVKGYLEPEDRKKLIWVKQYADKEIRILFQNASLPIYKGSKTTYGEWADKNGFKWAEGAIPQDWIDEARRYFEERGGNSG